MAFGLPLPWKRSESPDESEESYVEVAPVNNVKEAKVYVKVFSLKEFADVKDVVDALREGDSIVFVDIRPMKDKDIVELKKVVNRIKKTVEAIDGDIVSVSGEWIIATPSFAQVYRKKAEETSEHEIKSI